MQIMVKGKENGKRIIPPEVIFMNRMANREFLNYAEWIDGLKIIFTDFFFNFANCSLPLWILEPEKIYSLFLLVPNISMPILT